MIKIKLKKRVKKFWKEENKGCIFAPAKRNKFSYVHKYFD